MKKIAIGVLAIAILHSILFYGQKFGVSMILFVIPTLSLIIYTLISKRKVKNMKAFVLSIPITCLSATYALFNNGYLNFINFMAIIVLTCIMIIWAIYDKFNFSEAFVRVFVIIFKPFGYFAEGIRVFTGSLFKNKDVNGVKIKENKVLKQIFIGLIISLPLLLIIIALLISADSIFAKYLEPIKNIINSIVNFSFIFSIYFRSIFIIMIIIYAMAFICSMLKLDTTPKQTIAKGIRLQNVTLNTVLTMLNIVYLLFSIVQFTHLFTKIGLESNFDYATYARHGFFQLMIVTLINFAIITLTNLNKRETSKGASIYTKIMNTFLIVFTNVLLVSAGLRMHLYEQEYGYTLLRLTVYFILATEVVLTIPTLIYVFNKKFSVLKWYIFIMSVMLVIVNFINVDRTIARNNVNKYISDVHIKENAKIDLEYLVNNLSIDTAPELVRLYENTEDELLKDKIKKYVLFDYKSLNYRTKRITAKYKFTKVESNMNFQEFNLSKYQAKQALQKLRQE